MCLNLQHSCMYACISICCAPPLSPHTPSLNTVLYLCLLYNVPLRWRRRRWRAKVCKIYAGNLQPLSGWRVGGGIHRATPKLWHRALGLFRSHPRDRPNLNKRRWWGPVLGITQYWPFLFMCPWPLTCRVVPDGFFRLPVSVRLSLPVRSGLSFRHRGVLRGLRVRMDGKTHLPDP